MDSDHYLSQILHSCKKCACFDLKLAIVPRKATGLAAAVCALQLSQNRVRRQPV